MSASRERSEVSRASEATRVLPTRRGGLMPALRGAEAAARFELVGKLGRVRRRKLRNGKSAYWLDFRPVGRVWSNRGIRLTDEETARRLLEQIRSRVADGRSLESVLGDYLPSKAKANLVSRRLEIWVGVRRRECAAGSLSPSYLHQLEQLSSPSGYFAFFAGLSIFEITYGALEDFSLWLADQGLSPKSRRNYLAAFRSFVAWLHRRGELPEVPRFPLPKADDHEPRLLAIRDQDRVIAAIPLEQRGIFLAMARLGLRPGEARALLVADIHDGWLTVDKAAKGKSVSAPIRGTKSGKPKRLPLDPDLATWIKRHVDRSGRLRQSPLFPNPRTGKPWAHKALQRVWKQALEKVGLPYISLYEGTKHTFATDAIRRGVPERALQRFLGHASVQSTRRYARLADNALIEVLRPREVDERQASDKGSASESEQDQAVEGGPSWIRTRVPPVMSRVL